MSTVRKTITLTDTQDAWIRAQVASGGYTNDSEYVRHLIRQEQEKLSLLRAAIDDGLASGVSSRSLDEIWHEVESRYRVADE
ncbi:antitoxin ParD1/3/4 [Ectothiorhodosinus mongolicus]|uniref:Antitoxin ParD n=1 Tax=Ectothiorhodosinus mongolicus TaxID=233100 RepID=A0A1R3VM80_9GAMM|nr:type II toxin-antitoxin system ParD family antitoxin [Ectothiorhodosinus mongolicus]ULX57827.1 type II toxin-antitoxin system ParD family antitoxin [Ectothiorhodosinus mongolicus]SIT65698.1 antitoxin ParD1/3/4 [Ectothiorhodosinus mongolicus]